MPTFHKEVMFCIIKLIGWGWIWLHGMELFLPANKLFETVISSQQAVRNSSSTQQDFKNIETFSRGDFKSNDGLHCYSHERFKNWFLKSKMTKSSISQKVS